MYYALMDGGDYFDLSARDDDEAIFEALCRWSAEEAEELEIEVYNDSYRGDDPKPIISWENWRSDNIGDYVTICALRATGCLREKEQEIAE